MKKKKKIPETVKKPNSVKMNFAPNIVISQKALVRFPPNPRTDFTFSIFVSCFGDIVREELVLSWIPILESPSNKIEKKKHLPPQAKTFRSISEGRNPKMHMWRTYLFISVYIICSRTHSAVCGPFKAKC